MNIITAKTSKNLKIKSYRFHCRHCANIKLMFEIFCVVSNHVLYKIKYKVPFRQSCLSDVVYLF